MDDRKSHQWVTFSKGRVRLLGCSCCGQIQLPSNRDAACPQTQLGAGVLMRNGYRCEGLSAGISASL
ncbi:MAG: hypothetical protein ACOY3E_15835 [Pseudomonadota bacterium]|nr:hypothetical protein [Permianibacter sp.]